MWCGLCRITCSLHNRDHSAQPPLCTEILQIYGKIYTRLQVWWETVNAEERPVVVMRLADAVDRCGSKISADKMAQAMISQVS